MTQPAAQTAVIGTTYGACLDALKWWKITLPSDANQVVVSVGNQMTSGGRYLYVTFDDVTHDSSITGAASAADAGVEQIQLGVNQHGDGKITIPIKKGPGRKTTTFALGGAHASIYTSFMVT